jgi:asparagine synthase (glutamine-hydrolysing)
MCGIVGKIDFNGPVDADLLHRMCAVIEHRGPDSLGVYARDGAGIGIRRLAIIDVAGGDQPIFNEDGSVLVVMNGEIYNFQSLRSELVSRGHGFSSHSDAEVLVHLYEECGDQMVHRLRGMFAFAIWDIRARRLFCARDRVGKKPLFWSQRGDTVWFASEIRALLEDPSIGRAVDHSALAAYLTLQYVPHPLSAFKEIRKVPPGSTLTVTADGATVRRYWSLDYSRKLDELTVDELAEQLREHIREATRIRLMSEVPLGAFLSGGIDSSAVVAAMAEQVPGRVKTFSIGFTDAAFDELKWARIVARQFDTDHHEFVVKPDAMEILPKLARQYGEPFADSSAIPSFYLAELAGKYVTVALNGDGGDESFAGYRRYLGIGNVSRLAWLPLAVRRAASHLLRPAEHLSGSSFGARLARAGRTLPMSAGERYATWMSVFDEPGRRRLFTSDFAESLAGMNPEDFMSRPWAVSNAQQDLDRMLDTDVQTYLPGALLVKMDIATMAYSVEARSPFLDQELMQFAAGLPPQLKLSGQSGKTILKYALRTSLPEEILERPKMGFGVPLAEWFRSDLRDLPAQILLDPVSIDRGYFVRGEIEHLISEHQQGQADHSAQIWALLQLEMWHREVVEAPRSDGVDLPLSVAKS